MSHRSFLSVVHRGLFCGRLMSSSFVPSPSRHFSKRRIGRGIQVSVDTSTLPKVYTKEESDAFVALLAKEIMKRYSSFVAKKWVQTISLCLADPTSTRLFLSRSLTRSSSTTKWFSQLLWDIMETKQMIIIPIPERDHTTARKALEEVIMRVDRARRPVKLSVNEGATGQKSTSEEDESGRSTSGGTALGLPSNGRKKMSFEAAVEALLEIPPLPQSDVIKTLDLYAKEMIPDDKLVPLLLKSLGYHSAAMVNLLKFLHIPINVPLKKKIAIKEELRQSTEASLRVEIAKLFDLLCDRPSAPSASASPSASAAVSEEPSPAAAAPSSPSSIFKRTARSGTVWETRPYSAEHCLYVEIDAHEIHSGPPKPAVSAGLMNSTGTVKYDEGSVFEWRRDESVDLDGPYKVFLSRLPDSVTVQSFVTAFKGCKSKGDDDDATKASKSSSAKKTSSAAEDDSDSLDWTSSPVVGVHLVKEDLNRVASKILFDLPRAHAEPESDVDATSEAPDASAAASSSGTVRASAIDTSLSPTQQLSEVEKLCANGKEISSDKRNKYKNLDNSRMKKTILKKTTPESYAFVLLDSQEAFESATAEDMRVLGVSIEKSATPVKTVQKMRRLIFEIRYDFINNPDQRNVGYVIDKLNEGLAGAFAVREPRWPVAHPSPAQTASASAAEAEVEVGGEERAAAAAEGVAEDRSRRHKSREMSSTGPSQPAFLHIQCPSHEAAWRVYLALKSLGSRVPGEATWIESKHYRWVRTQSEALSAISSPMLVDHFFHRADKGFLMH